MLLITKWYELTLVFWSEFFDSCFLSSFLYLGEFLCCVICIKEYGEVGPKFNSFQSGSDKQIIQFAGFINLRKDYKYAIKLNFFWPCILHVCIMIMLSLSIAFKRDVWQRA